MSLYGVHVSLSLPGDFFHTVASKFETIVISSPLILAPGWLVMWIWKLLGEVLLLSYIILIFNIISVDIA